MNKILLIAAGAVLLIGAVATWLILRMRRRRGVGRVSDGRR
jgi:hypothetical protein